MSDTKTLLYITGMGAVSSVGLTAPQTASSIRAGIRRYKEHPYHYSRMDAPFLGDPELMTYAPVPFLDPLTKATDRLLNLSLSPLEEVFNSAGITRDELPEFGLFLALPPPVSGIPDWGADDIFLAEFFRRAAIKPFQKAILNRSGASGFYHALLSAKEALETNACQFALVGGVDSFLDEYAIRYFDDHYRLKSDRNRDGFIPGEASAYVILEKADSIRKRRATSLGVVKAIHVDHEEQNFFKDQYSSGGGLTRVFKALISGTDVKPEWILCDLNGESYRSHEWALVKSRMGDSIPDLKFLWHPAECIGDIRAAGPAIHLIMTCQAFVRGYAPSETCLMFSGDDLGERGGCLCSTPE